MEICDEIEFLLGFGCCCGTGWGGGALGVFEDEDAER